MNIREQKLVLKLLELSISYEPKKVPRGEDEEEVKESF